MDDIDIEVFDSFLPKIEFDKLSNKQKIDYYFNFSDWFEGVINSADPGDYGFPELFERFCKEIYPRMWNELVNQLDFDAYKDPLDAFPSAVYEVWKRNRVANEEIVLYLANAMYGDEHFYSAATVENNSKPAERNDGDLPLFFQYHEELETGYIGGRVPSSVVHEIGRNKAERLQHLRGVLSDIQLKKYAEHWDERSSDSCINEIDGYCSLCKYIAAYFRKDITDSQFMAEFCGFVPEAKAREVWRDVQKQIDNAPLLQ